MNRLKILLITFFMVFITGCVSKPKVKGKVDLCGLIVDENNCPVEEYVVCYKNNLISKSSITNSSGIFIIPDVAAGQLSLKGEKSGFTQLNEKKVEFYDRTKIFCYQVYSIDSVIEEVNKLIEAENYTEALEILKKVSCKRKSKEGYVISCYKSFLMEKKDEKKKM